MILEDIFDNRIGLGKTQYITVFFLSLIELNDGAQLILTSFLNPVIKKQWNLNDQQVSSLASIFYLGVFAGSILSGRLSDTYGRKPVITAGSILQIVISSMFFWVDSYSSMLLARLLYGFSNGFTAVIVTSVVAEIMPGEYRGKGIVFQNFCGSIGKLYGMLLAFIFLNSYDQGNWRAMMLMSCLPNLFVFTWALLRLQETPRYLIASKRIEQACQVLDSMIKQNNPSAQALTDQQKDEIALIQTETAQKGSILDLFSKRYFRITICLCIAWFSLNLSYYGQLISLPFIFGGEHRSFSSYALTVMGEVPSLIISFLLIDRPGYGRKNSLIYFFVLSSLMHFAFGLKQLVLFSTLCRLFMKMSFQMLYACSTEMFATENRSLGFGFTSATGRLGATIIPFIIIPMVNTHLHLIFFIFGVFCLVGGLAAFCLPYEPLEYALDEMKGIQNLGHQQNDKINNTLEVEQNIGQSPRMSQL